MLDRCSKLNLSKQTIVVHKAAQSDCFEGLDIDCLRVGSSISCPTFTGFVGSALMRFCTCVGKPTETKILEEIHRDRGSD